MYSHNTNQQVVDSAAFFDALEHQDAIDHQRAMEGYQSSELYKILREHFPNYALQSRFSVLRKCYKFDGTNDIQRKELQTHLKIFKSMYEDNAEFKKWYLTIKQKKEYAHLPLSIMETPEWQKVFIKLENDDFEFQQLVNKFFLFSNNQNFINQNNKNTNTKNIFKL